MPSQTQIHNSDREVVGQTCRALHALGIRQHLFQDPHVLRERLRLFFAQRQIERDDVDALDDWKQVLKAPDFVRLQHYEIKVPSMKERQHIAFQRDCQCFPDGW
eukprot:5289083-Alexandrium_andersonii.AAC.1